MILSVIKTTQSRYRKQKTGRKTERKLKCKRHIKKDIGQGNRKQKSSKQNPAGGSHNAGLFLFTGRELRTHKRQHDFILKCDIIYIAGTPVVFIHTYIFPERPPVNKNWWFFVMKKRPHKTPYNARKMNKPYKHTDRGIKRRHRATQEAQDGREKKKRYLHRGVGFARSYTPHWVCRLQNLKLTIHLCK